ncbi:MAG: hypothetical protein L0Z62_23610 [Gemmataceae bacterium]|nr:hypothetical protein [Gemmataceae bacterium]
MTLQARDEHAGLSTVCPGCRQQVKIPGIPEAQPAAYRDPRSAPPAPPAPALNPPSAPSSRPRERFEEPEGYGQDDPGYRWSPRPRPVNPSGSWAWRWCSPSMLVLALLMLPWPFLEVACTNPVGGSLTLLHQSGIQVMTGTYSENSDLEQLGKKMAAPIGVPPPPMPGPFGGGGPRKEQLDVKPAVLMIVIPILLLSAAAIGLALGRVAIRLPLVGSLVAVAVVLVIVQMAIGFPLDTAVRDKIRTEQARAQQMRQQIPGPGPGGVPFPAVDPFGQVDAMTAQMIRTHYTPIFWLWLVLILGALGPVIGEGIWYANRRAEYRHAVGTNY